MTLLPTSADHNYTAYFVADTDPTAVVLTPILTLILMLIGMLMLKLATLQANVRDGQYDATLLHWAVNEGHTPTVEHLLACGADVRLTDGKQ